MMAKRVMNSGLLCEVVIMILKDGEDLSTYHFVKAIAG